MHHWTLRHKDMSRCDSKELGGVNNMSEVKGMLTKLLL
jgi:hypothetical protein